MSTPAERLLAAADLLDKRASEATPGVWKLWGMEVLADQDGTSNVDTAVPVAHTSHETGLRTFNASYIAAMQPSVGKVLAAAMRSQVEAGFFTSELSALAELLLPREQTPS